MPGCRRAEEHYGQGVFGQPADVGVVVDLGRGSSRERRGELAVVEERAHEARDPRIGDRPGQLADAGHRHFAWNRPATQEILRVHDVRPGLRAGDLELEIPSEVLDGSADAGVAPLLEDFEDLLHLVPHHRGDGAGAVDEPQAEVGPLVARHAPLDALHAEELLHRVPHDEVGAEQALAIDAAHVRWPARDTRPSYATRPPASVYTGRPRSRQPAKGEFLLRERNRSGSTIHSDSVSKAARSARIPGLMRGCSIPMARAGSALRRRTSVFSGSEPLRTRSV